MLKNKKIWIVAALVVLVVAGLVMLRSGDKNNDKPVVTDTQPTAKVTITDTGFMPTTIKVKTGSNVVWTNTGSKVHHVITNPHSSHDGLSGLDSKSNIPTNGTYSYKFDKAGTYEYHDETDPTRNGTVIVE